jgi:hypothetical protein
MSKKKTTVYKTAFVDLDRVEANHQGLSYAYYEFVDKHYKTQDISLDHKIQVLTQIIGELLHKQTFPNVGG